MTAALALRELMVVRATTQITECARDFVLAGAELPVAYVEGLKFYATGELESAMNEAFIKLLEFAHDHHLRATNLALDAEMRSELQRSLEKIAALVEPSIKPYPRRRLPDSELDYSYARQAL